jgi:hypothetical protein
MIETQGDQMANWLMSSGLAMVAGKVLAILLVCVLFSYVVKLARAGLSTFS